MHRPTQLLVGLFAALGFAHFVPRASAQTPVVVPNPTDCATVPACGGCEGAAITDFAVRLPSVPPWQMQPKTMNVDAFDPTLGQLVKAEFIFTPDISIDFGLENLDPLGPCIGGSVQMQSGFTVSLDELPSVNLTQPISKVQPFPPLTPYDGVLDFGGTSGASNLVIDTNPYPTICVDDPLELASLTAPAGTQLSFSASTVNATSQGSGCGAIQIKAITMIGLRVDVKYTYCPNRRPVLADDDAETCEGVAVNINVLANDSDPDGQIDCTSIDIVSGPTNGTAVPVNCAGLSPCVGCRVRYTPNALFTGADSFMYRVMDDDGCWSDPATVMITVLDAPVAVDDQGFSCQGDPVTIDVLDNDNDPDGTIDCGSIVITTQPTGGSVQISPSCTGSEPCANCVLVYTPNANFSGSDSFRYRVSDEDGCQSNIATVSISVNARPITNPDNAAFCQGTSRLINVLANDSDPDGVLDCTSLTVITQPMHGTAVVQGCVGTSPCVGCRILYTPAANYAGPDSFTYQVTDNTGCDSAVEVVSVNVRALPVANNDTGITCEDQFVDIDVLANDSDPDNALDCSSILITDQPDHGSVALVGCVGTEPCPGCVVRYTPNANYSGPDSFKYVVDDATTCTSNEATVNVTVRAAPVTQDDQATTCSGEAVNIDVLDNDDDPDGIIDCGSLVITSQPSSGTAVVTAGCTGNEPCNSCFIRYTPTGTFVGSVMFTYRVSDATGCVSDQTTVTVNVTARPNTVDDAGDICQGESVVIDVLDNDTGPIDATTVEIVDQPANGIILGIDPVSGEVTYRSDGIFCGGQDVFTYRVSSTTDCESPPATVRVTVRCGPVANDDSVVYDPSNIGPVDVDVLENDFDPDGPINCASLTIITPPNHGTAVVSAGCVGNEPCNGCFVTYTPDGTFDDFDSFVYEITDSDGCVDTARVVIQLEFSCAEETNRRVPGALLLFPEFDSREGVLTMVTVTNTLTANMADDVELEYVYRREGDCAEFNRTEILTPADTLTVIVKNHVPDPERGFLYVVARCPESHEAIAYNGLIGQYVVFNGMQAFSYSVNAVSFEGIGGNPDPQCPQYALTDIDNDDIHDLDGLEYTRAPDQLVIPRFIGQMRDVRSELVLVGLSGGAAFTTSIDLLVFNDNEELFLRTYSFDCWTKVDLNSIAGVFTNDFLLTQTMHDIQEIIGAAGRKSGWILLDGALAESSERQINDPAIYAVLVECVGGSRCVADLPFELCEQSNGDLFPVTPLGDPND
ncbi:MAG: tandem-95 repeat protein [Planctomycetes bacterium]|nr:tandem-95 repeat protein [Planctomycetota bacterium]